MSFLNLPRLTALVAVAALSLTACTVDGAGPGPDPSTPAAGSGAAATPTPAATPITTPTPPRADVGAAVRRLEERYDSVVGLYAVDTGTETEVTHRADRRFGYASTFKALAAGAVLERSGPEELARVVNYDADDLQEYSPVAERHVDEGMTMYQIIDAAVQQSDNTAGNLLLDALGGPAGLQSALRAIGDETTRPARYEPELNDVVAGDVRDTSTPRALAHDLRAYGLGDVLDDEVRATFVEALRGSVTGMETIRAGVPEGWVVGDKTGTSGRGGRNDIGIVWPPGREPVVLAVLTQTKDPEAEPDDALLAEVTAVAVEALGG
ncbi:class A beta-lactamase [Promicromonospora panici]|uniref:class A beta-lactamase n=1 Tax=Promicromonospora panici TaxID=2219658 RepID=UPI00101B649E|nr:class A beta-lactamase [Promicromonospora panici]